VIVENSTLVGVANLLCIGVEEASPVRCGAHLRCDLLLISD
jgi:hypothetical protein